MHLPRFLTVLAGANLEHDYELLPSGSPPRKAPRLTIWSSSRRRVLLFCLVGLPTLLYFVVASNISRIKVAWTNVRYSDIHNERPIPPTFDRFRAMERALPQHNSSLPFPEGKNGRFVWISNEHWGLGWNNIFQAAYMNAHMAYLSNRAYVFHEYTWHSGPEPYVEYNGHLIPSRIPLLALVAGPLAGGSFPPDRPAPRAVGQEYFRQVCPPEETAVVEIEEINKELKNADVIDVMNKYANKLLEMEEGCVELRGGWEHPFDWQHFGDVRMTTMLPTLMQSPIMTEFSWSPLVIAALRANAPVLTPTFSDEPLPKLVDDLAAVHVRRGDYEAHCMHFANWSSSYMGWNQLQGLPDRFVVPPGGGWGENTPENTAFYLEHCFPDIAHIARRVRAARHDWDRREGAGALRRLYILTNGERGWVAELKKKILEDGDWAEVHTSRDMTLSSEQIYIAQAIDMAIAERAALFIGNGFSSLSANVVLLRTVNGHPIHSNRFL